MFSAWLRRLRSDFPRPKRPPTGRFRPRLEALEGRDLPSFAAPVAYSVTQPIAVVTADVNGDGKPDLITLAGNGTYVSVQLNNGNGTFGPARWFFDAQQWATAIAVGDVNGDGKADIVLANKYTGGPVEAGAYTGSVTVLLGNGQGGFTNADIGSNGAPYAEFVFPAPVTSIALAHLYGGSGTDLVAARAGRVYVVRPAGSGHFQRGAASAYFIPASGVLGGRSVQVAVGDFNGDGKPDIVTTEAGSISVLLNNGDGTFGAAQGYAVSGAPTAVAVGDVNGDGKLDIVTANANGTVSVLVNAGNGTFGAPQSYAIGGAANSVALGDFNHDGHLDIVTTGAEMDVLLNTGDGTFGAYQKVGPAGSHVAAADFNGDGYPDLAQIDASGAGIDVLLNNADWTGK